MRSYTWDRSPASTLPPKERILRGLTLAEKDEQLRLESEYGGDFFSGGVQRDARDAHRLDEDIGGEGAGVLLQTRPDRTRPPPPICMRSGLAYAADAMHLNDIPEGSAGDLPGTVWLTQGEQNETGDTPEAAASSECGSGILGARPGAPSDAPDDLDKAANPADLPAVVTPGVPRYARPKEARPRTIKFLHIFRNELRCEMVATNRFSQSEAVMPCRDATSWDTLLDECTKYLHLSRPAKRLFQLDGREITQYEDVKDKMELYVSEGEECRGKVVQSAIQKRDEAKKKQLEAILAKAPAKPSDDIDGAHDGFAKARRKVSAKRRTAEVASNSVIPNHNSEQLSGGSAPDEHRQVADFEDSGASGPRIRTQVMPASGLRMTTFD